jgi:hypothetical protein
MSMILSDEIKTLRNRGFSSFSIFCNFAIFLFINFLVSVFIMIISVDVVMMDALKLNLSWFLCFAVFLIVVSFFAVCICCFWEFCF